MAKGREARLLKMRVLCPNATEAELEKLVTASYQAKTPGAKARQIANLCSGGNSHARRAKSREKKKRTRIGYLEALVARLQKQLVENQERYQKQRAYDAKLWAQKYKERAGKMVKIYKQQNTGEMGVLSRCKDEDDFVEGLAQAIILMVAAQNEDCDMPSLIRNAFEVLCKYRGYKCERVAERRSIFCGDSWPSESEEPTVVAE